MVKQYVQHISGQGEKWEIQDDPANDDTDWQVKGKCGGDWYYLPRSEYALCEPPPPVVQWKDVTAECVLDECGAVMHNGFNTFGDETYRRRKMQILGSADILNNPRWAIIIEQKVSD